MELRAQNMELRKPGRVIIFILLLLIVILGGIVRSYTFYSMVQEDDIYFFGHDPYYHVRRVFLILADYPNIPRIDFLSAFPEGLSDPWPPAFDFFMASLAKIAGAGVEDTTAVEILCALTPVLAGTVTLMLFYMLLVQFTGCWTALLATFLLSFMPGHVQATIFGRPDHHCIEPFFIVLILYTLFGWYNKSQKNEKGGSRLEHYFSRDLSLMLLLGLFIGLAFLSWMGSVIFIGFLGTLLLIQSIIEIVNGTFRPRWWLYLSGSFLIAFVTMFPFYASTKWSLEGSIFAYYPTWLQLIVVLMIMVFVLYLTAISLFVSKRDNNWSMAIFIHSSAGFLIAILVKILFPDLYNSIADGIFMIGTSKDVWLGHTAESQPLFFIQDIYSAIFALKNFGYGIFLFPFIFFISIYNRWKSSQKVDIFMIFLILGSILFGLIVFISKRYAALFSVFYCFFLADSALIVGRWLFQPREPAKHSQRRIFFRGFTTSVVLVILLIPVFGSYYSIVSHNLKDAVSVISSYDRNILRWIRGNTPPTGRYFDPGNVPRYGILAPNLYGHWLLHFTHRPVFFSPFAVRFHEAAEIFLSEDVTAFDRFCTLNYIRYILLNPPAFMIPQYADILRWSQHYQTAEIISLPNGVKAQQIRLNPEYYRPVASRLFELDGNMPEGPGYEELRPLQHYRLIRDGDIIKDTRSGRLIIPIKFFEFVEGAHISGTLDPKVSIEFVVRLVTNTLRVFDFRLQTKTSENGTFEITLPYATTGVPPSISVIAKDPYEVYIEDTLATTFHLTENDIQVGSHYVLMENNELKQISLQR